MVLNLYEEVLRLFFLTENQRQGNDQTYAVILNIMRVGEHTKEDMELLRTRVRPKNHPDLKDALYIAGTKVSVNDHNTKCLNELYESRAKYFTKLRSNFKPHIQKDGTISKSDGNLQHEYMRTNVLTAIRKFIQRLKTFRK